MMEKGFWEGKWREGQLGFHSEAPHEDLARHADRWLEGGPHRILVPLAGKTHDLAYLAGLGHEVVGVEIVREAVEAWAAELGQPVERSEVDGVLVLKAGTITMLCSDFFTVPPSLVGKITRVWDRAANVALPPEMRARYTEQVKALAPGALLLLNTFEYPEGFIPGPPFSISAEEVAAAYGESEVLHTVDMSQSQPWKDRGATSLQGTTRLVQL